jgi:hypothetical protein
VEIRGLDLRQGPDEDRADSGGASQIDPFQTLGFV